MREAEGKTEELSLFLPLVTTYLQAVRYDIIKITEEAAPLKEMFLRTFAGKTRIVVYFMWCVFSCLGMFAPLYRLEKSCHTYRKHGHNCVNVHKSNEVTSLIQIRATTKILIVITKQSSVCFAQNGIQQPPLVIPTNIQTNKYIYIWSAWSH